MFIEDFQGEKGADFGSRTIFMQLNFEFCRPLIDMNRQFEVLHGGLLE